MTSAETVAFVALLAAALAVKDLFPRAPGTCPERIEIGGMLLAGCPGGAP